MKDIFVLFIIIFSIVGTILFCMSKVADAEKNKDVNVILIEKDSTIKNLKVEMNDEINKAINANDSDAIKQFIKLVTE